MSSKTESSQAGKKSESAAKKAQAKNQIETSPGAVGYVSLLGEGQDGMTNLSSYLEGADEATRARVVTKLQQTHGNNFVQRMLLQREEAVEESSTQEEHTDGGPEQQRENWLNWLQGAKSGASSAVMVWSNTARLIGVHVTGPTAIGGHIVGSFPTGIMSAMVSAQGAPTNISLAFARATANAWGNWTNSVSVPGLPWYPQFAAYPGPHAPPTANIPTPLIVTAPGATIVSGMVAGSITSSVGESASEEGAQEAIQQYADWLSNSFTPWLISCLVTNVMGYGTVPTFAPPFVPAGMVIGNADSFGPFLLGSPPFGT